MKRVLHIVASLSVGPCTNLPKAPYTYLGAYVGWMRFCWPEAGTYWAKWCRSLSETQCESFTSLVVSRTNFVVSTLIFHYPILTPV